MRASTVLVLAYWKHLNLIYQRSVCGLYELLNLCEHTPLSNGRIPEVFPGCSCELDAIILVDYGRGTHRWCPAVCGVPQYSLRAKGHVLL